MNLHDWATRWNIPMVALRDLQQTLGTYTPPIDPAQPLEHEGKSEAFVQSVIRLEASKKGVKLWRNNVGALIPKDSKRPVRFGLANDSEAINAVMKSGDLIGVRRFVIQPAHVGATVGQFVSREVKRPGWQYNSNDEHERAQLAWIALINSMGGDACFATGEGTI